MFAIRVDFGEIQKFVDPMEALKRVGLNTHKFRVSLATEGLAAGYNSQGQFVEIWDTIDLGNDPPW